MKAKDIEALLNQKTKAINDRKGVQIHRLLTIMRNQTLACIITIDFLFLGIYSYQFELIFLANIYILLLAKLIVAVMEVRKAKVT